MNPTSAALPALHDGTGALNAALVLSGRTPDHASAAGLSGALNAAALDAAEQLPERPDDAAHLSALTGVLAALLSSGARVASLTPRVFRDAQRLAAHLTWRADRQALLNRVGHRWGSRDAALIPAELLPAGVLALAGLDWPGQPAPVPATLPPGVPLTSAGSLWTVTPADPVTLLFTTGVLTDAGISVTLPLTERAGYELADPLTINVPPGVTSFTAGGLLNPGGYRTVSLLHRSALNAGLRGTLRRAFTPEGVTVLAGEHFGREFNAGHLHPLLFLHAAVSFMNRASDVDPGVWEDAAHAWAAEGDAQRTPLSHGGRVTDCRTWRDGQLD